MVTSFESLWDLIPDASIDLKNLIQVLLARNGADIGRAGQ